MDVEQLGNQVADEVVRRIGSTNADYVEKLEQEVSQLRNSLAETEIKLSEARSVPWELPQPKDALLVLDESTDTPTFFAMDVAKFTVDLAESQALRQKLTARNFRQVFLIVQYTTDVAERATWQTVIDDVTPAGVPIVVCPAPARFLSRAQIDEFRRLLDGLRRLTGGPLHVIMPLRAEMDWGRAKEQYYMRNVCRTRVLYGIDEEQETEEAVYWAFQVYLALDGRNVKWPCTTWETHKERRERLRDAGEDVEGGESSKEERAAQLAECMERYERLEWRIARVEQPTFFRQGILYSRVPIERVRGIVAHFTQQQLADFWLRMDRWEAWVRHDEGTFPRFRDLTVRACDWFTATIRNVFVLKMKSE